MLKYKILIKLFVMILVLICCVYRDTIQKEVVMLCLLVTQPADTFILMHYVMYPSENTSL
jgi:hypothetical protein